MFRPTVLSCWLLLGAAASAQNQVPPAVLPSPGLPVPLQPALPSATTDNDVIIRGGLEFPNADVKDVLTYYERLTSKKLIYDAGLGGPITILVKTDLTKGEALRIIEASLLLNGFSLIPSGGDLITVLGLGKNPRGQGIPIISDELQLPDSPQVVTFVYKLTYADPTEVAQVLSQYIVPSQTGHNQLLPLPKSQSLVITESTTMLRGLLKIIRQIDTRPADVESIFITLERADAKAVVENLTKLLNPQEQGTGGAPGGGRQVSAGGGRPAAPRVSPEGTPIPGDIVAAPAGNGSVEISSVRPTEDSLIVGRAVLTPDERTNRIHIVTRPENLPFIRELISEFDRDVPFGIPAKYQLQSRPAEEIFPVIVKAISDPGAKTEDVPASGGTGTGSNSTRQQGIGSRGGSDSFGSSNSFGGGGGISSNVNDTLETTPRETRPVAVTLGSTRLIADNATNSIIVIGNEEVKSKVQELIEQLDVRAPQVMLHTVVGEITLGENEQFGVDYILRKGGLLGSVSTNTGNNGGGTGGTPGTATGTGLVGFNGAQPSLNFNSLLNQRTITQIAAAGSTGLSGFFTAGDTLNVIVSALEATNRFRVTSRPSIFAQNNQIATIASGQEIAIPGNIQSSLGSIGNGNDIIQNATVQYKKVELKLEILPLINSEREVTLDIVQRVDELTGQETVVGNSRIPTVATRTIKTKVSVPNQATIALGGLIRQSQTNRRGGIPVLSRIPVIGALFRTTSKEKTRTELVVLIRPEVTMEPCEDIDIRERQLEYLNVDPDLETTLYPPNTRKRGSTEELLRRSQLKLRTPAECVEESLPAPSLKK